MRKKFLSLMALTAAAAILASGCFPGDGNTRGESAASAGTAPQPVRLVWYMPLGSVAVDTDLVIEELNRYTRKKIGVEIEYHAVTDMDYQQKMPIYINTGEYFDICFTSAGAVNYLQYVAKNEFLDITNMLLEHARETYVFVPQSLWDGVTVDGKIYGVPSYKELGWQGGILVNTDMARKYGADLSRVKTIEDYERVLDTVKEKSSKEGKAVIPVAGLTGHQGFVLTNPYESLAGNPSLPGAARVEAYHNFAGQTEAVFNQYASPEYKKYCNMARRWYQSGYTPLDPVKYDSDTANRDRDFQSGKLFSYLLSYAPGTAEAEAKRSGHGVTFIPLMAPLHETRNSLEGIMVISSKSEHPREALEFINLLNTDRYVGTLLRHGIEGVHHTPVDENRVDKSMGGLLPPEENRYDYTYGWQFGTPFNQKWDVSYPDNIVDLFSAYNRSVTRAPHLGFNFQPSRVDRTLAAVSNVVEEYAPVLEGGMVEPDKNIQEFLEALENAGVDSLLSEIRMQLAEYNRK